ncbi:MAG TPA: SusD/RagB family nutrient-binding outer membrane lipoprotein [Bacteroidales bacterium]
MRILIKYISIVALIFMAAGCTKNFTDFNTNPYQITDTSLTQKFNNIGGFFKQLQMNIYLYDGLQTDENLTGDAFAQYMVPPTPFAGNVNNVTYYYVWYGDQWNNSYNNTMSVILYYKKKGYDVTYPQFYAWANLLKIFTMQRTTDYYGPIIYSNYGSTASEVDYDSQHDIYYSFFSELDRIVDTLSNYVNSTSFKNFDLAYSGNVKNWIKVANSLRLRLAIRISKVDPAKAKTEAEKAISQTYGVIESNDDNFNIYSQQGHALGMISIDWGDTRMSATMESVLKGYNDPRMPKYFQPATTTSAPAGDYKGIRQGIDIKSKDTYEDYSPVGTMFYAKPNKLQIMTAAEVYLLRAEGVLRGWNMGGQTAQQYYEAGVKASFDQYILGGFNTYIADATSKFADYVDTHNSGNSFSATSNVTIAWNESLTNEQKLEKIITQKWIAEFPDGIEAWAEFRRTGYPKLEPVKVNYSGGAINTADFVRRVIYPDSEYQTNPDAVAKAAATLTGTNGISGDKGGSRVWWDTAGPNF